MKNKIGIVCVVGVFAVASSNVSFATESAQERESYMRAELREKEIRLKYRPVREEEYVLQLTRPLWGIDPMKIYSRERTCYQPGFVIEVQSGKIIFASRDSFLTKETPCPKLPFE